MLHYDTLKCIHIFWCIAEFIEELTETFQQPIWVNVPLSDWAHGEWKEMESFRKNFKPKIHQFQKIWDGRRDYGQDHEHYDKDDKTYKGMDKWPNYDFKQIMNDISAAWKKCVVNTRPACPGVMEYRVNHDAANCEKFAVMMVNLFSHYLGLDLVTYQHAQPEKNKPAQFEIDDVPMRDLRYTLVRCQICSGELPRDFLVRLKHYFGDKDKEGNLIIDAGRVQSFREQWAMIKKLVPIYAAVFRL